MITSETASVQRIRDFLSVAWPVVTETCAYPLESTTWLAAVQVVTSRCGGQPGRLAAMGDEAFTAVVRDVQRGWGGQKAWRTICGRIFAALTDTEGVRSDPMPTQPRATSPRTGTPRARRWPPTACWKPAPGYPAWPTLRH